MNKTNIATGVGGVILGTIMVFSSTVGGQTLGVQTVDIDDDGTSPKNVQRVTVITTETKEVVTSDFEGTLSDLSNEILPRLYAERDAILAEIAKYEALKTRVQTEVNKLPVREVPVEEPVATTTPTR